MLSFFFSHFLFLFREHQLSRMCHFNTTIFTNLFTRILSLKDMYCNWSIKHGHLSKLTASDRKRKSSQSKLSIFQWRYGDYEGSVKSSLLISDKPFGKLLSSRTLKQDRPLRRNHKILKIAPNRIFQRLLKFFFFTLSVFPNQTSQNSQKNSNLHIYIHILRS